MSISLPGKIRLDCDLTHTRGQPSRISCLLRISPKRGQEEYPFEQVEEFAKLGDTLQQALRDAVSSAVPEALVRLAYLESPQSLAKYLPFASHACNVFCVDIDVSIGKDKHKRCKRIAEVIDSTGLALNVTVAWDMS